MLYGRGGLIVLNDRDAAVAATPCFENAILGHATAPITSILILLAPLAILLHDASSLLNLHKKSQVQLRVRKSGLRRSNTPAAFD